MHFEQMLIFDPW